MSDSLTCDTCGKTERAYGLVDWYRIDRAPGTVDVGQLNEVPPPFDFCSWDCVSDFARSRSRAVPLLPVGRLWWLDGAIGRRMALRYPGRDQLPDGWTWVKAVFPDQEQP